MDLFKIKKHIESKNLILPISKDMMGKIVQIISIEGSGGHAGNSLDRSLDGFFGRWQDDRSAYGIVSEIYAGREANVRFEKVKF
jgi:hypothetical protein